MPSMTTGPSPSCSSRGPVMSSTTTTLAPPGDILVEALYSKDVHSFHCGSGTTVWNILEELRWKIGANSSYQLIAKGKKLDEHALVSTFLGRKKKLVVRVLSTSPPSKQTSKLFSLRHSLWNLLALVGIANTIIVVILGPSLAQKLLKLQLTLSPIDFRKQTANWTDTDIARFKGHFVLDWFVYPILYSLFGIAWLAAEVYARGDQNGSSLLFRIGSKLSFLGGACDVVENTLHLSIIHRFRGAADWIIVAAATFSLFKWVIVSIGLLVLGCLTLARVFRMTWRVTSTKEN